MISKIYIFLSIIYLLNSTEASSLDCPLEWVSLAFGDKIPGNAIYVSATLKKSDLFARKVSDGDKAFGRYKEGFAYLLESNSGLKFTSEYQVLTNPNACTIKWLPGQVSKHVVTYDPKISGSPLIGRAVINQNLIPGAVINGQLKTVLDDLKIDSTSTFESLTSFSPGLSLKMTDFIFLGDGVQASENILGMDDIHNNADVELTQSVSMKQKIFTSVFTSVSTMSSSTHSIGVDAGIDFPLSTDAENPGPSMGLGVELKFAWTKGSGSGEEGRYETETELDVIREVIIPSFSSVTVCSRIKMANDFEIGYIATGRYSAPGVSGAKVLEILAAEGKSGRIEGNTVISQESGKFRGSLGLSTEFFVVPYGNLEGCSFLGAKNAILRHYNKQE